MSEEAPQSPPGPMTEAVSPTTAQINFQSLQARLQEYVREMKPGLPIENAKGAIQQKQLWGTIKFVLGQTGSEFVAMYAELLRVVAENRKGVFNERYVYRFMDQLAISSPERKNFERMLNLLMSTCDPKTRQFSLKQVDMRATLQGFADNNIQQRISGYYAV